MKQKRLLIAVFLVVGLSNLFAQSPGSLDLNLNGTGIVKLDMYGDDELATKVLVQPDNKIVTVGLAYSASGYNVAIARLFPDGSPDPSFSYDGFNQTLVSATGANVLDAALQSDGKIVVVGFGALSAGVSGFLVRYESDGQLDATFGNNGILVLSTGSDPLSTTCVEIAADGKIVCGGISVDGAEIDALTVRLNADGTFDNSYGVDGVSSEGIIGSGDALFDIVIQPDGKIVGVGSTENSGGDTEFFVIRFNADGTLDNTFNSTGFATLDFGMLDNEAQAIALQGGKIIVAGKADIGAPVVMATARFLSDGQLDLTYGGNGKFMIPYYAGDNATAYDIAIQQDGKILFGGTADDSSLSKDFALARVNTDGTLDNSFDTDGKVQTDLGDYEIGFSLAVQDDGMILLAGRTSVTSIDFALVRYISGVNIGIGEVETYIGSTLVYPNPVTDNAVTVEYELTSDQSVSIDLLDFSGKLVSVLQSETKEQAGLYQKALPLPSFSAGTYLLKLNTNQGSVTVRLTAGQ